MLAVVRPDSWNIAVFVHVFGAMALVGAVVTAATAGLIGWRAAGDRLLRFSYWTLLTAALPAWILMRAGAEWARTKEGWDKVPDKDQPAWLTIGFITSDASGAILLIALILGGIALWRARSGASATGLLKASTALATITIAFYIVAVWAMGGKPS